MNILPFVAVLAVIVAMAGLYLRASKQRERWEKICAGLGLDSLTRTHWAGEVDGVKVTVRTYLKGSGKNRMRFTSVECRYPAVPDISLGKESILSRLLGGDVAIGDDAFDSDVKLRGERGELLALLDDERRAALRDAAHSGWQLASGTWSRGAPGYQLDSLERTVRAGVGLSRALALRRGDIAALLATRATSDSVPRVRLAALDELARSHRGTPAERAAFAAALRDPDPHLRLAGGRELGDVQVLVALLETSDGKVVAGALDALCEHHQGDAAALAALSEPRLVGFVGDAREPVKLAAIRALGDLGSIAAVPVLVPLREKFLGGAAKDAARDAILAIQARAGDVAAGRLSMAEADARGAMALADARAPEPASVEARADVEEPA
ncbi:MAG: hypothetical protein U1F43_16710 [Myxococcota bacterium]